MKPHPTAFETLVDAHYAELYHFALAQCGRPDLAQDLVQETFSRAWGAWGQLKTARCARAWLFTILRREHARLYERQRPETRPPELLPAITFEDRHCDPESLALLQVLDGMADSYREPLLLQVLGGFSCTEISRMLGITENTVSTRVYRARRQLRSALGDRPDEVIAR